MILGSLREPLLLLLRQVRDLNQQTGEFFASNGKTVSEQILMHRYRQSWILFLSSKLRKL